MSIHFILGGLLTTFLFLKEMKKNTKYLSIFDYVMIVLKFYLHRFLRITPVYMIAVMITATLPSYFSSGPNKLKNGWPESIDTCNKNWWYNLLYVNNIFFFEENASVNKKKTFIPKTFKF